MTKLIGSNYQKLLIDIKERIRSGQYNALRSVNKELISLYWDIGKMISERQKGKTWGKAIVERLAKDLQKEYPGMQGFSTQNLWYMRQFYHAYYGHEKLQPLVGEISWTKHVIIMSRCKDDLERQFYIRMTKKFGWSKNILIHQIENQSYEKTFSIGIILCKDKTKMIVEYALRNSNKPIGIGTYQITQRLPKELRKQLPSPEQIQELMDEFK